MKHKKPDLLALLLNPKHLKSLDRRARALEQLHDLESALDDSLCAVVIDGMKSQSFAERVELILGRVAEQKAQKVQRSDPFHLTPRGWSNDS